MISPWRFLKANRQFKISNCTWFEKEECWCSVRDLQVFGPTGSGSVIICTVPVPLQLRIQLRIRSLPWTSKWYRKILIFTVLWLLKKLLSLNTDVSQISNQKNNFIQEAFFSHLESNWKKVQDPDPYLDPNPDPYSRTADQRIRIQIRTEPNQ